MDIRIKRVYEPADPSDGFRVLVDRIWPRGLMKKDLIADLWLKDAAPSTELRKWFNHEHDKWNEFKTRYFKELSERPETISLLLEKAAHKQRLTLLIASRDEEYNQGIALKEYLLKKS